MPGLAPSPSDQQLQPGRGAGPGYYDLPFASAAAVSEGRGCGEGAPEAMSGRPEMGIKLGGLWGRDKQASYQPHVAPLGTPVVPGPAVPQRERTAPACSDQSKPRAGQCSQWG